jgi:hypothetical protein
MRKLTAAIVLTIVIGVPAFAGEVLTPPCAPPIPGEVLTPPCATAPGDLDTPGAFTVPGDLGSPTLASSEMSLSEIAANVFLSFLPLF